MAVLDTTLTTRRPVSVALVNNMPDAAFLDTEDQFRRAITAGDGGAIVLRLYTLPEITRGPSIAREIEQRYHDLDELWAAPPDGLIVTGTEPLRSQMVDEAYWPSLTHLLEWAADEVPAVLLSCLASHASLLAFDGLRRAPRVSKCSGVFHGFVTDPGDPLARGLPAEVPIPHSRINEVPEQLLRGAGYRIVVGGAGSPAGWAVAARECGDALFVLCQGHPEYDTLSLLREYRRDVRRYLIGSGSPAYPRLPDGYLSASAARRLQRFADRAVGGAIHPATLWTQFPFDSVAAGVVNTWSAPAATLYANWITHVRAVSRAVV